MKKQFQRFRQITDQAFLRPEKSDALTEDLHNAEKRVDLIKQSCEGAGKRINSCIQRISPDFASGERRQKSTAEKLLAMCMQEYGEKLGEDSILGIILSECAKLQDCLATELLFFKSHVELAVLKPILSVVKDDYPTIAKLRKQLTKLTQDMDTARTKYHTAEKHCQQMTSNSMTAAAAKVEFLKEEAEDTSMKVEQCRDALATEMFNLISHEPKLSWMFVEWYRLQADYHQKVLASLQSVLPVLESKITKFPQHPVFGIPLEEHLQISGRSTASVIEFCACWLLETAFNEEGLFRIGGSASKVKKLKSAFDACVMHVTEDLRDPHTVAGVLKLYLRELPEPLMTTNLYDQWLDAARIPNHDEKLQALWSVVSNLPEKNYNNLRYLIKFLAELTKNSEINKMSSQNLAIVMAPNLMWSQMEELQHLGVNMTVANYHSIIVEHLITFCDWFFPEEVSFALNPLASPFYISTKNPDQNKVLVAAPKAVYSEEFDDVFPSTSTDSKIPNSPNLLNVSRSKLSPLSDEAAKKEGIKLPITRSASCSLELNQWTCRIGPLHANLQSSVAGTALCPLQDDDLEQSFQHRKSIIHSRSHEDLLCLSPSTITSQSKGISNSPEKKYNIQNSPQFDSALLQLSNSSILSSTEKSLHTNKNSLKLLYGANCGEKSNLFAYSSIERPSVPPPKVPESQKGYLDSDSSACSETHDKMELQNSFNTDVDQASPSPFLYSHNNRFESISFMDDSDQDEKVSKRTSSQHPLNSIQTAENINNCNTVLFTSFQAVQSGDNSEGAHINVKGLKQTSKPGDPEQSIDIVPPYSESNIVQSDMVKVDTVNVVESGTIKTASVNIPNKQHCTVIQVSGGGSSVPNTSALLSLERNKSKVTRPLNPPPPKPSKPLLNSETQNTRL